MGFLDKAKEQASALAAQGQAKVNEAQASRHASALIEQLGTWEWAQRTGRDEGNAAGQIERILAELAAHEAEHGPIAPPVVPAPPMPASAPPQPPADATPPPPAGAPPAPPDSHTSQPPPPTVTPPAPPAEESPAPLPPAGAPPVPPAAPAAPQSPEGGSALG